MLALILILIGYNVILTVALLQHGEVHEELNYEIRVVKGYENYVDNALEILQSRCDAIDKTLEEAGLEKRQQVMPVLEHPTSDTNE